MTITIIDYGVGNLKSVQNAIEYLGEPVVITNDPQTIVNASKLIFPGQGACGHAMAFLKQQQLIAPLYQAIQNNIPFLGICLGFQLLFDYSEEDGGQETLGIVPGTVKQFSNHQLKVPQMGWNRLDIPNDSPDLAHIATGDYVYFVHSYYANTPQSDWVSSTATYGNTTFVASICKQNVWGTQFHPEKSGTVGLTLLKNFIALSHRNA